MRAFLVGALGAAALYGASWGRLVPDLPTQGELDRAAGPSGARPKRLGASPGVPRTQGLDAPAGASSRAPGGRVAAGLAPSPAQAEPSSVGRSTAPTAGSAASVQPAEKAGASGDSERERLLSELPPKLRKTFQRLSELQQVGPNPGQLADRVQTLDVDPAELDELRRFAERFVDLPPDRVKLDQLK